MKALVSKSWLNENLSNPKLIILDASISKNAAKKVFESSNIMIPRARRFDLKNVFLDTTSPFPNTVPNPEYFQHQCQKLGINKNSEIVVYDNAGIYTSPRVWWLFNIMGHDNISVLNGGLPDWVANGFATVKAYETTFKHGNFKVNFNAEAVILYEQMIRNCKTQDFLTIDARSKGRFNGTEKEPRTELQSGHIPNSINIHYQDVLEEGKFKSKTTLKALFDKKYKGNKPLVFSCGSGITACIVLLASNLAYSKNLKVYDGSWTEWAIINELFTK